MDLAWISQCHLIFIFIFTFAASVNQMNNAGYFFVVMLKQIRECKFVSIITFTDCFNHIVSLFVFVFVLFICL